jgi:precorrin-6y C5,15-methyltransferase (decarboxylating) CbiE subunit
LAGPLITIIGCGPGAKEYLTQAAVDHARSAELLIGPSRLLALFPESTAEQIAVDSDVYRTLDIIAENAGKKIAIFVTGDPGLFSLSSLIIKRFGRDSCVIVPGISSVQLAFAKIGRSWENARIISAHKLDPSVEDLEDSKIALLGGRPGFCRWLAGNLTESHKQSRIFLCENLSFEDESIREIPFAELEQIEADSRAVLLIIRENS